MAEQSFFVDVDCYQQKKNGQNAFGDSFQLKRFTDEGRVLAVLSDGLGSGIKANILATMTATMILKFIEEGKDILKATEVIMNTLPVCQVRKISYATFSAFECTEDGHIRIVEEGNPDFVHIRNGRVVEHEAEIITSTKFTNRHMHLYNFQLEPEDRLVFCSDGVTQAGMGTNDYKLGWRREGLISFLQDEIYRNPTVPDKIVYIASDGNYSTLVQTDNEVRMLSYQLGQIEKMISTQLGNEGNIFIRIGKSLIINRSYIYYINIPKQKLTLSDVASFSHSVTASKEALKQLKELLEKEVK